MQMHRSQEVSHWLRFSLDWIKVGFPEDSAWDLLKWFGKRLLALTRSHEFVRVVLNAGQLLQVKLRLLVLDSLVDASRVKAKPCDFLLGSIQVVVLFHWVVRASTLFTVGVQVDAFWVFWQKTGGLYVVVEVLVWSLLLVGVLLGMLLDQVIHHNEVLEMSHYTWVVEVRRDHELGWRQTKVILRVGILVLIVWEGTVGETIILFTDIQGVFLLVLFCLVLQRCEDPELWLVRLLLGWRRVRGLYFEFDWSWLRLLLDLL